MKCWCQRKFTALLLWLVVFGLPGASNAAEFASIVFGSFRTIESAEDWCIRLEDSLAESFSINEVRIDGLIHHRVVTVPTDNIVLAHQRLEMFREEGFKNTGGYLLSGDLHGASTINDLALTRIEPARIPATSIEDPTEDELLDHSTSGIDDELLDGFDDFEITPSESVSNSNSWYDLGGQFSVASSYSYNLNITDYPELKPYDGLSKVQTLLRLHTNLYFKQWRVHIEARGLYDWFYDLEGEDQFPNRVLDEHHSETEWHEVYLQGDLTENLDLKTGRQILTWGRSDNLRVLDQLNPLDHREPGSTDIVDIRLPVNMTRVRYALKSWTLELVAIHEIRFNKLPAAGSEFLPGDIQLLPENKPGNNWFAEHGLSLTGVFSGWDVSVHHARLYDDEAYVDERDPAGSVLRHSHLKLSGLAFNRTVGSWLFKGEYAGIKGYRSSWEPQVARDRTDIMLGIEYGGRVALETSVQHLHDWNEALEAEPDYRPRDLWQSAIRINRTFLNQRLTLLLVALFQGRQLDEGHIIRTTIDYKPMDALTTSLGLVIYSGGERPPLSLLEDKDRILLEFKYHF